MSLAGSQPLPVDAATHLYAAIFEYLAPLLREPYFVATALLPLLARALRDPAPDSSRPAAGRQGEGRVQKESSPCDLLQPCMGIEGAGQLLHRATRFNLADSGKHFPQGGGHNTEVTPCVRRNY